MKRKHTGEYEITAVAGERVKAFIPSSLPPVPGIDISPQLQQAHDQALVAIGELNSLASLLPDYSLLLYSYVRKEAVLSSRIEGTQSSLSDLLVSEIDGVPGVPLEDVTEVSNYVAAMQYGLDKIREGLGRRQESGRVSYKPELDRRNKAGQCRFCAASSSPGYGMHG